MQDYLTIGQIIISAVLIILILLQPRGQALGSAFGSEGGFYASRRGMQKKIFWATIVTAVLFLAFALLNLILR